MKVFGRTLGAALVFGAAMTALVGKETVSAEEAEAANGELEEAGIKGAQLINEATFTDLSEKAGRVDAAEKTAADAAKVTSDALAAAGAESIEALVAQRDAYKVKADKFDKLPGAGHTAPALEAGKSDVEEQEPDAHQKAIDNLPHNKALAGHPLFG
ncbi:hypothetical protein MUN81_10410 [Hymenobacter sp. 5317J-9]|uniref:hypothetical protein n=1 Tax=Hymenobacter sp. 5317J-9 TaxID=2932250 RepID=UPI001FD6AD06|nr:hypothetical protein [Hymenobacter sp. 5317J-9]UOQ99891.1 hypothetical protein MUN81_10410 [Hymenobacter sp. 5317J-9]